jgi:WD40 repeat protein
VRCPKCSATFRLGAKSGAVTPAPRDTTSAHRPRPRDDEDAPPPRRRKKQAAAEGGNKRLVWGLIGGGAAALLLGGVLLISLNGKKDEDKDEPKKDARQAQGSPSTPPRIDSPAKPPAKLPEQPSKLPEQPGKLPEQPGKLPEQPAKLPIAPPEVKPAPEPILPVARKDPEPADEGLRLPPPPEFPQGKGRPLLVLDPGGHTALARTVLFTPDGKRAVSAAADKTVRVWDVDTGETLRTFHLPSGPGSEGALYSAAISPDGKLLAVTGMPVTPTDGSPRAVFIYLIAMETGQVQRTLVGHAAAVGGMVFSPDSRRLFTGSYDKNLLQYDVNTGKPVRAYLGHRDGVKAVALSPNGQLLASACADGTARIWNVATARMVAELRGHKDGCISVAFSPDGQKVATGSVDGTIKLWPTSGGAARKTFWEGSKIQLQVTSLHFSRDGKSVLYTGIAETGKAGMLDLDSGKRTEFTGHNNTVTYGDLSPDGTLAISHGGNDNETFIWRTADGTKVHRLAGTGKAVLMVAWSGDGKSIAWGSINRANQLEQRPLEHTFRLWTQEFGPRNFRGYLAASLKSGGYSLKRLDFFKIAILQNGRQVHVFQSPGKGDRIYSFSLLPGGRAVMGGSFGAFLVDLKSGKLLRNFRGHSGQVMSISPAPNGRYFLTGGTDQLMCIWHPERSEPVLSLFFAGRDWIAWTPEGYYACSANGERLMGWQINNGHDKMASYHPAARFRASLYKPAAIRHLLRGAGGHVTWALALAGGGKPAVALDVGSVLPPEVTITAPAKAGKVRVVANKLEVKATAKSTGTYPVKAMRLLVNGRPFRGRKGIHVVANPQLGEVQAAWTVDLPIGKHTLAVLAESEVSKGLSPVVQVDRPSRSQPAPPNLYIFAAGVSKYPGRLRLNFAASDAKLISEHLKLHSRRVFSKVEVRLIQDEAGTKAGIMEGLAWLESVMTPKDVGVFFFSGHGAREDDSTFYLVPVDANVENVAGTCVNGDAVKQALANIPGRVVCMLDCCHSGSVTEGKPAAKVDDLVRDLVTDEYGVVCMCSSLGEESSLESSATRAGFFTLGVVEGLAGGADFNRDRIIYIHELDLYAKLRVKQLSGGRQNPISGRPSGVRTFPLGRY